MEVNRLLLSRECHLLAWQPALRGPVRRRRWRVQTRQQHAAARLAPSLTAAALVAAIAAITAAVIATAAIATAVTATTQPTALAASASDVPKHSTDGWRTVRDAWPDDRQ